ncbi:MAG TPA: hypothetical protein VGK22_05985 [Candidatus Angelobacter sp.]
MNAFAITIKNQPSWFIFNNGDEAFLLTAKNSAFPKISDGLRVAAMAQLFGMRAIIGTRAATLSSAL